MTLGIDALTGRLTRTSFLQARQALEVSRVVALLDLNRLKSVNALREHRGGDAHIRSVAHAVIGALSEDALICRWGGDEFMVLVPGGDQVALRDRLAQLNRDIPGPLPGMEAFSVGMTP